jgi:polysaccharide pyruvyl transferase WcaK-like protein
VIGNFSGRNTGDAAILGSLLEDIDRLYAGVEYDVPTINTSFVRRTYTGHAVHPVGLMPWNLSVKILGLPVFRSILRSDLVLVTDAILFDLRLFNPLFNYLSTMALALPLARRRGIPVVLYNVSLGPVSSPAGRACMRRVVDAASKIIVRDGESLGVMKEIGRGTTPVIRGADCALNVTPADAAKTASILEGLGLRPDKPAISFNVNSYIDVFVRGASPAVARARFLEVMAEAADRAVESLDAQILFVITQPMDTAITNEVLLRMRRRRSAVCVSNRTLSYRDIAAILSRMDVHVGMRTHSLILASAANVPVVGVIATPKNRGYMRSIGQQERTVEFPDLNPENLFQVVQATWTRRAEIREQMRPILNREKARARATAGELAFCLGTEVA